MRPWLEPERAGIANSLGLAANAARRGILLLPVRRDHGRRRLLIQMTRMQRFMHNSQ
jgi:hypothetical protein